MGSRRSWRARMLWRRGGAAVAFYAAATCALGGGGAARICLGCAATSSCAALHRIKDVKAPRSIGTAASSTHLLSTDCRLLTAACFCSRCAATAYQRSKCCSSEPLVSCRRHVHASSELQSCSRLNDVDTLGFFYLSRGACASPRGTALVGNWRAKDVVPLTPSTRRHRGIAPTRPTRRQD